SPGGRAAVRRSCAPPPAPQSREAAARPRRSAPAAPDQAGEPTRRRDGATRRRRRAGRRRPRAEYRRRTDPRPLPLRRAQPTRARRCRTGPYNSGVSNRVTALTLVAWLALTAFVVSAMVPLLP